MPLPNQPRPQVSSPLLGTKLASRANSSPTGRGRVAVRAATARRAKGKSRANQRAWVRSDRPAAAALEIGEVDALRLPLPQFHQVGEVVRLRFATGCQCEYIAQQLHGKPLSMMFLAASTIAGPVRFPLGTGMPPPPIYPPVMPTVPPGPEMKQETGLKLSEP